MRIRTRISVLLTFGVLAFGLLHTRQASARQCVFNKGGYVLKVDWVPPSGVFYRPQSAQGHEQISVGLEAVKSDTLTAGFGSCTPTDDVLIAFVYVVGCANVRLTNGLDPCKWAIETHALATKRITARVMDPVHTAIQPSAPKPLPCLSLSAHNPSMPGLDLCFVRGPLRNEAALVLIDQPSPTRYLDFWGSIFDVEWGEGGPTKGYGWVDGVDSRLSGDAGRGITDWNAHASWVSGGATPSTAAGFVASRTTALSASASRHDFAKLYAALSVKTAAVGRAYAGWVDGADPKATVDPGRGVSDYNTHYGWLAGGASVTQAAAFIGQRMNALTGVPRDVFAKLYADVSVLLAKCGVSGQCGP